MRASLRLGLAGAMLAAAWIALGPAAATPAKTDTEPLQNARASGGAAEGSLLYESRLSFTEKGVPLVPVGIARDRESVEIRPGPGADAIVLAPKGKTPIRGLGAVTIEARDTVPGRSRAWTVVERFSPDEAEAIRAARQTWEDRGYESRPLPRGSLFGARGELIDTREVLIAIAPPGKSGGGAHAGAIEERYGVETSVERELVERPRGEIAARRGPVEIAHRGALSIEAKPEGAPLEVADVKTGDGGANLTTGREDRHYAGRLYVALDREGALAIANALPLDELLAGIVPAEMFASAPMEALKAQAIAARTNLLRQVGSRHVLAPYLLCSSQHCQVYAGAGSEHPRASRAIAKTRGQVLAEGERRLLDARYSASCGGHGEDNDAIWDDPADESLRGRPDAPDSSDLQQFRDGVTDESLEAFLAVDPEASYCGMSELGEARYRWERELSAGELASYVAQNHSRVGRVVALEPLSRGASGRVTEIRVRGANGETVIAGDVAIRRALGGLRSALFRIETTGPRERPKAFSFRGAGHGHGVGMCQLGALGMAEEGYESLEILGHYYPRSTVKRLY